MAYAGETGFFSTWCRGSNSGDDNENGDDGGTTAITKRIVTATATARAMARATAAMITTTTIATDQDDGDSNGEHYYECGLGRERRE